MDNGENKVLSAAELVAALANTELDEVYASLSSADEQRKEEYKTKAVEMGFASTDELVSFYTVGDASDKAPGSRKRNGLREMFALCMEDYSGESAEVEAVRNASTRVLLVAALRSSILPLLFVVAFAALIIWRGHPVSILGLVVAILWLIFQMVTAYKQAGFLKRAYGLFRKYGVHVIKPESEEKIPENEEVESEDGKEIESDAEEGDEDSDGDQGQNDAKPESVAEESEESATGEDEKASGETDSAGEGSPCPEVKVEGKELVPAAESEERSGFVEAADSLGGVEEETGKASAPTENA